MLKVQINNTGTTYWPKQLRDDGFEGEMEVKNCGCIVFMIKPGSTHKQIIQSLETAIVNEKLNSRIK